MSNQKKPLVTVMVPAYNHEKWVEETILSVVKQSYGYENIQLIVTDDCSSDQTPVILRKLAAKYNFELILNKQNKGISLTLNKMIDMSKGKYITGIASDDIMMLDKTERQINILTKYPDIDILAGSAILIDKDGKEIVSKTQIYDDSLVPYSFEDLFLRLKPGFPAGSMIIKRELYQRIGAYDPIYKIEDIYFWLKATYHNAKVVKCNNPFIYYRVLDTSISANNEFMIQESKKIRSIYKDHPKYSKAVQNIDIYHLSKLLLNSKIEVLQHLIKSPVLLFNKKAPKILLMLFVPKYFLKKIFQENSFRHATN